MYLRAIVAACVLCVSVGAQSQDNWVDPSPHTRRLVAVDPSSSIEVLDWGGTGRALVLLAQLGQTAHLYDDWAPRLARIHRVLAITRRGYGASSSPAQGYSMERLATDIVAVLDAEKLQAPILVGNQFAGEEMSWIATRFSNRIGGLVYLDAAYDRTIVGAEAAITKRIPVPPPSPQDMSSAQAVAQWMSKGLGGPIPEAEVRQIAQFGPDGRVIGERTPPTVARQIIQGIVKVDYPSIRVPVLAIYVKQTSADSQPGCRDATNADVRQACGELFAWKSRHLADSEALIRTASSNVQVIELTGANPFVFLSNEPEVMQAIDRFARTR